MTGSSRRLLLATTNPGKIREIRQILSGLPFEVLTLADLPAITPPEETGSTFAENARLKALAYAHAAGLPALAEDSGLEIDELGGAPGIQSARFGGATTYPEKFQLIYKKLHRSGAADSSARFVCATALAVAGRVIVETRGTVEGVIAREPRGNNGFGYDPIFFYPPFGRTLAEVSASQKAEVSHRGQAFRQLRAWLIEHPDLGSD